MAYLQNLSVELLSMIIEEITSIRDLAALSTQCKRLNTMVNMPARQRYHRISLTSAEEVPDGLDLLLEILKSKKLAAYVRQLKLYQSIRRGRFAQDDDTPTRTGDADEDVIRYLREAMAPVGFLNEKETEKILDGVVYRKEADSVERHIDGNTLGMLFLSACPNLGSLEVYIDSRRFPQGAMHTEKFIQEANDTTSGHLWNLRKVHLLHDTRGYMYDPRFYDECDLLGTLRYFHRLPSIELLSMNSVCLLEQHGLHRLAPRKSNITKIHLGHSSLSTDCLCAIIDHCKVLEEFKYSNGGRGSIEGSPSIYQESMGLSLSRHASTLRVLDLDTHIYNSDPWERWSDSEPFDFDDPNYDEDDSRDDPELREIPLQEYISFKKLPEQSERWSGFATGSLRDFTSLTHLSIDVGFFVNENRCKDDGDDKKTPSLADLLPPNIEYLCIRGYKEGEHEETTQCVSGLLPHLAMGRLPHLTKIDGVTKYIPIAEDVVDVDENERLLWVDPYDPYAESEDK